MKDFDIYSELYDTGVFVGRMIYILTERQVSYYSNAYSSEVLRWPQTFLKPWKFRQYLVIILMKVHVTLVVLLL